MAEFNSDPGNHGTDQSGDKDHRDEYMHSDYVLNQRKVSLLKVWQVVYPLIIYSLILIASMYLSMLAIVIRDVMIQVGPADQMTYQEYNEKTMEAIAAARTDAKVRSYSQTFEAYTPMVTLFGNLLMLPIALLLYGMDMFFKRKRMQQYLLQHPEKKPEPSEPPLSGGVIAGISLMAGVGMCLAANLFVTLLKLKGATASTGTSSQTYSFLYDIQNSVPFQVFSVVIISALVEELLFRGVIFRRMRNGSGLFFCVIFSSMIYASFYGTAAGFVYGFLISVGACYLYHRTGYLTAPVLYHIFLNAMTLVFSLLGIHTNAFFGSTRRIVLAFLIGLVLLAFVVILIEYYLLPSPPKTEKQS